MKNPGERLTSGNEENNEQLTDARAAKIGRGIFDFRQRMAERRHEKSVQKTLAKIASLSEAEDGALSYKRSSELQSIQMGNCENLSDERVVDAILNSFSSFHEESLSRLVDRGVPAEKIFGNEKLRGLCAAHLKDRLLASEEKPPSTSLPPSDWFSNPYDYEYDDGKMLQNFYEEILRDEDVCKQIAEDVGPDTIFKIGDKVIDDLAGSYFYGNKSFREKTAAVDSRFEMLKKLGYDYFREDEKETRVKGLVGKDNAERCSILYKFGYIDADIVSEMYAAKMDLVTEYIEHGQLPEISGYHKNEREKLEAALYIPWRLEPSKDDEAATYWHEQTEKCGFDALAFIAKAIREKVSTNQYSDETVASWWDGRVVGDSFFKESSIVAFKRLPSYMRHNYDDFADVEHLLTFYSNNSEKISDPNERGLVINWAKIKGESIEQTESARIAYLEYAVELIDREGQEYDPDTYEIKTKALFSEDGTPTDAFYNFRRMVYYSPKGFLPFMDEKWQDHFTPSELAAYVFIDNSQLSRNRNILQIIADTPEKFFDENGPTSELFLKCFEEGCSDFFEGLSSEDMEKAGLDDCMLQLIDSVLAKKIPEAPFDSSNIIAALATFIRLDADDWYGADEAGLKVREAFATSETKDLAMKTLRAEYERYLQSEDGTEFPISLVGLSHFMHKNDGAGPLVQIEAFLDFVGVVGVDDDCKKLTAAIEERMTKNHWDNQEKTNFYAVSAEILKASPDLYKEFAELFVNIKDKGDFETFTKDVYPLYRAKLALLREYDYDGDGVGHGITRVDYSGVDVETLKNQLHNALLPFNLQELSPERRQEGINRVREIILSEITELFRSRLGIRAEAIPGTFTKEDIAAIEDMSLYLGNIASPTKEKKDLIGLFLALRLDKTGGWDNLRAGGFVDVGKYMGIEAGYTADQCIKTSRANNPINAENTSISDPERLGEFSSALQADVSTIHVSTLQTIDQRLQNLISNIEDLADPDLYPDDIDKKKIAILERHSPKAVGSVAAKMWQRASGKEIPYSEGEQAIADDLMQLLNDQNTEATPENIKAHLQDGFNAIKIPFTIRQAVADSRAVEAIGELQKALTPPDDIAAIFGKLGEEFRPQSGVLAVGADLEFLENLIVKHEDKLDDGEKTAAKEYIAGIRAKMGELETIYEKIVKNFEKYQKSMHGEEESRLRTEIEEVNKIIKGGNTQTAITTTCTNNMSTIINNMRACLSAKTKGCNNDTDLTFGESYKFYLFSSSGSSEKSSTTDEIVYFVPEEHDGEKALCFVMDQIYGHKNTEIFAGHVETIIKKAEVLKKQFPEVPIRIFIPGSTLASSSISMQAEDLRGRVTLPAGVAVSDVESATFNVPRSGFADHYIEFGNSGARTAGERKASGIEIVL